METFKQSIKTITITTIALLSSLAITYAITQLLVQFGCWLYWNGG